MPTATNGASKQLAGNGQRRIPMNGAMVRARRLQRSAINDLLRTDPTHLTSWKQQYRQVSILGC